MRMQNWNWIKLLEMRCTGRQSSAGGNSLLLWLIGSCGSSSPDGLQGDFQLIRNRRLQLEFMVLSQHGDPDVTAQWVQIWLTVNMKKLNKHNRYLYRVKKVQKQRTHMHYFVSFFTNSVYSICGPERQELPRVQMTTYLHYYQPSTQAASQVTDSVTDRHITQK